LLEDVKDRIRYLLADRNFDSPQLVSFPGILQAEPESKAAFILLMLLEGIGEEGIKLKTILVEMHQKWWCISTKNQ
jgi:hypothetical protein